MSARDDFKKNLDQLASLVAAPRPMMRHTQYGFPEAVLAPGEQCQIKAEPRGMFRAQKLLMVGLMKEIRGHYKIKRARLPLLNRDHVESYSRIHKWSNGKIRKYRPGKTVIAYASESGGFVREYLPSSVVYTDVDPMEYIDLLQMFCGAEPQMPPTGEGVSGLFYGAAVLGNGIYASPTDVSISLVLKNKGDVVVRVRASILGAGYSA